MKTATVLGGLFMIALTMSTSAAEDLFQTDSIATSAGTVQMTFIGHASLILSFNNLVIHVDPWNKLADYSKFPKADLVLITHEHMDHLDTVAINTIRAEKTKCIASPSCADQMKNALIMKNGETKTISGIKIEAIPAYNIIHKRENGQPYHPKGSGNGYILTLGDKRIYIAGDTEKIPEINSLKNIDIAFLPMNLPYTMTPEMVANAAKEFKPHILYPYHFGDTDCARLVYLLKDEKGIDVRVRKMM